MSMNVTERQPIGPVVLRARALPVAAATSLAQSAATIPA
jgi:hypothetical protein